MKSLRLDYEKLNAVPDQLSISQLESARYETTLFPFFCQQSHYFRLREYQYLITTRAKLLEKQLSTTLATKKSLTSHQRTVLVDRLKVVTKLIERHEAMQLRYERALKNAPHVTVAQSHEPESLTPGYDKYREILEAKVLEIQEVRI